MAIIIILAGLILATSGYVQNKGARSRAETEIAAMSAALENYKADNGIYPSEHETQMRSTHRHRHRTAARYTTASLVLYRAADQRRLRRNELPTDRIILFHMFKPNRCSSRIGPMRKFNGYSTAISDPFGNPTTVSRALAHDDKPTRSQWITIRSSICGVSPVHVERSTDSPATAGSKNW